MAETSNLFESEVEQGCMLSVPLWESHQRGRNWMAVIKENPRAPGGFERYFVPKGRGRFFYKVDPGFLGCAVVFGADYFSVSGNRTSRRWYGVVEDLTPEKIVIRRYSTPTEAIAAANPVAMTVDQGALMQERAQLLARVKEIDEQFDVLEKESST